MSDGFEPPGPGSWALDRSHYPGGTTPISAWLITEGMHAGMERVFAELGAPVRSIDTAFVNGFHYTRVVPLIGADKPPRKLPPAPVLKLMTRIHPEFRRRARQAAVTLADMPSLTVAEQWRDEIRPRLHEQNLSFQEFDLDEADDDALERHVVDLLDHLSTTIELHFWLHGHDLGPIARYIHACEQRWGIPGGEAARALAGASPSTTRPVELLCEIRSAVEHSDHVVGSLDDVSGLSPGTAQLLDQYLDERGAVLATGYDITSLTLGELPGVVLDSIRSAQMPAETDGAVSADLRERVPVADRATFDEYLGQARFVMDMRDDNGPLTAEWPLGLLRLALLAAGRRLTERSLLHEVEHALELTPAEARRLLAGPLPDADTLAARSRQRLEAADLDPPATIGPPELEPPLDVLPEPLALLVAMIQTVLVHMGMDGTVAVDGLQGVGIGDRTYRGRACRAATADEAIEKIEPGDVLVVRATSPAFNAVLGLAGAVVTANGGAMSHAAVLARELGIPAVIGAQAALDIADGATVEVDPLSGTVRVI